MKRNIFKKISNYLPKNGRYSSDTKLKKFKRNNFKKRISGNVPI